MPGEKGKIVQGKRAKYAVYLGDKVRIFKIDSDRIRLSTDNLIVSINSDGRVTNGQRLYKILNVLYQSEHRVKRNKR
jgi:hypothetical protein